MSNGHWKIAFICFLLAAVTLAFLLIFGGCGSALNHTARSLNAAKLGTDAAQRISAPVLHRVCLSQARECTVPAAECVPLKSCQVRRAAFNHKLKATYAAIDLARIAWVAWSLGAKDADWRDKALNLAAHALGSYQDVMADARQLGIVE